MAKTYLYVTPFFPSPKQWRGAYCYDFVVALRRQLEKDVGVRQWKVLVLTEGDGSDYEIGGVKVHTFKAKRLPSNIFPNLFARANQKAFLSKVRSVLTRHYALSTEHCFDSVEVCHAHTANFGVYALALKKANPKCKTLLHHHDLQSFGLNLGALKHCWLYNMIQFPILRRMHERIDTHVFISEASRRSFLSAPDTSWTEYAEYKKQMWGLPYRSVKIKDSIILHNGVDKKIFNAGACGTRKVGQDLNAYAPRNTADGISTSCPVVSTFTIGCVGNFSKLKGQDVLLRAVARLKEEGRRLKVRFVGSGETLEECKKFAAEKGINAEFLTEMRHEELPDFYRTLDLFVLPSWFEGFGCVFTEAHSCGVPFIGCIGQGIEDVIPEKDRGKWLCKQRDPEDLAKKIGDAIELKSQVEVEEWKTIQKLNEDQDIDKLVDKFVEEIGL